MALEGLKFLLYEGTVGSGTLVATCTELSVSQSKEAIDVTSKDSNNNRELLSGGGTKSMNVSFSGIYDHSTAIIKTIEGYFDAGTLNDFYLEYPLETSTNTTYKTQASTFFISSYENTGVVNGAMTFSMTLESSGAVTTTEEAA